MQAKTKGIILHQIKHTDSAGIVTVYTREFGRTAYMVRGANKKKSACRAALLQPLSIVEMDVSHFPKREIQHLREIRIATPFYSIPFDPLKSGIAFFISELLTKILKHSENDEALYHYIESSICELDRCEKGIGNFHLAFMAGFCRVFGFAPQLTANGNRPYFDMLNGNFENQKPEHFQFLEPDAALLFGSAMNLDYGCLQELPLNRTQRSEVLKNMIEYFNVHLPGSRSLNSIHVLQELWI